MELTKQEMDIAITSHLSSCICRNPTTTRSKKRGQIERKGKKNDYIFGGHPVCRLFLRVHCISEKLLKNIIARCKIHGVSARRHGLSQRLWNTLKKLFTSFLILLKQMLLSYQEGGHMAGKEIVISYLQTVPKNVVDTYKKKCKKKITIANVLMKNHKLVMNHIHLNLHQHSI